MTKELTAAVRHMLLPISPSHEEACLRFVTEFLSNANIDPQDQPSWILIELRRWKTQGSPSGNLRGLVEKIFFDEERAEKTFIFETSEVVQLHSLLEVSKKISSAYFEAHSLLINNHLFTHDVSRQILSHLGFIAKLRLEHQMSASEISRLLSVRDARFDCNWPTIKTILSKCGIAANILESEIRQIFEEDSEFETSIFADLDLMGCITKIAESAKNLGCPGNFEAWLADVLINDCHPAFLAMLHYQLSILEKFDHALTYPYEFSPRGVAFLWLAEQYQNANIAVAASAFLNNAKATLRLDKSWAIGRDNLKSATAFADILEQMESLGILARRELATLIRCALHRYIRLQREAAGGGILHEIPVLSLEAMQHLCRGIASGNTSTHGVIEQRFVDAYTSLLHPTHEGWRSRGVGDSVFAANTFRKKFGDCEFENTHGAQPIIQAYEAHGGRLSLPYIEDHLFSFMNVLGVRLDELESHQSFGAWRITITFIAHAFTADLPDSREVIQGQDRNNINLKYLTFAELFAESPITHINLPEISRLLIQPLNDVRVPSRFRESALALCQPNRH